VPKLAQWPAVTTTSGAINVPVQRQALSLPTATQSRNSPLGTFRPPMTRVPPSVRAASWRAFFR
jgi:hypothetical protein